jgi:hypothetical protein
LAILDRAPGHLQCYAASFRFHRAEDLLHSGFPHVEPQPIVGVLV